MLQPKHAKQLDSNIKELVANGGSNEDIDKMASDYTSMFSDEALKKKEKLKPTSTTQKSVSATPIGSSVGKGFPEIDTNSVATGLGVQPKVSVAKIENKKTVVNYEKPKDTSFFDYLKENLDTGLATVSKSIYDAPGMIYDAAAAITNPIAEFLGADKSQLASSDKLAKDLGFKNIPSEILKKRINEANQKINAYSVKNGGDALTALENGNYSGAAKLITGTTVQSLPIMVAAMASGGSTPAMIAIGSSTASTKNAQLKEENPEMSLGTRITNATTSGVIEAVTGHLFTGASGVVMKRIIADKGVELGSKIIGKSFRSTIEKLIEKNPLVGALGEVIEESAVEFGNQANDIASGIRTEFDIRAIKNAGLSATGMGGIQTVGVYGAKGYVKTKTYAKLKATNKEVFKLRSEIENGNLSDENKVLLGIRADRLEAENKKLLGTELEKVKALPKEQKTELNALNIEFEDLKSKFDDIDEANDIPANLKPPMKEEIKLKASKNQKRKTEILSQNEGLEIKSNFSKFEGVEPDFDLENGDISSLPLKEQNRLNKLAVQELTNGDKTIEYTKEQASQKANEIYTNEKTPPTSETKPQAEVPQQAEAEKVATPPVEDVVAPSVEKPISLQENNNVIDLKKTFSIDGMEEFHHASDNKRNGRLSVSNAPQFGDGVYFSTNKGIVEDEFGNKNTTSVKLNIENPVYAGSNEWSEVESLAIEKADKDYGKRKNLTLGEDEAYFRYDKDNISEIAEIPSKFISDAARELGYDAIIDKGSHQYENEVVVLDESKIIYPEDEATPSTNTPTNENLPIGASNVGEVRATKQENDSKESVQSSVDGGENKGDVEVSKKYKLKDKGQVFNVDRVNGKLEVTNSKGEKVSKPTERAVLRKHADNYDFTQGDKAIERSDFADNNDAYNSEIAAKSNNPSEIAETIIYEQSVDKKGNIIEPTLDHKESIIADGLGKIKGDGFVRFDDRNNINPKIKKSYFDKEGRDIDEVAQELSDRSGVEITEQDIADFIKKHPKGTKEFYDNAKNKEKDSNISESNDIFDLKKKFEDITGFPSNNEFLNKAIEQQNRKSELNSTLDNLTDAELLQKHLEIEQFNTEQNGGKEINQDAKGNIEVENNKGSEQKPEIQRVNTKPTAKERIKANNATIDEIKNSIKGIDEIFGFKIKVDGIDGLAKQGVDIIDVIADIVKQAMAAGIHIDEAISKTIEHLKKSMDFDVDINAIHERINPKKEIKESTVDLESFRDSWNLEPSSGEFNQYDSGNTIEREHGTPRNNQTYEVQKDLARVQIGIRAIQHAKELFGAEYVEKTLSFIEQANLSPEKKAVAYVLLENEMDARTKASPKNVGEQKLQDLVRSKSQEFLANSARAIGAGRFRVERFRELAKKGFSEEDFTNVVLTKNQIDDKAQIKKAIEVTPDDINNESENQESDEDFVIEEPKVKRNKEAVKKDISNVLAQMRKDLLKVAKGNVAMSSIPYAAQLQAVAPHIIKLSKLLAELGGMTTRQIVNEVYNDIKQVFPGINKTDVSDILKEHSAKRAKPKTETQEKQDYVKDIVKKALIDKGFSREITVTKNERDASGELVKDADGRNVKTKEKRTILDWKKLAGEEGSVEKIRKNVSEALAESGYTKKQIGDMSDALEKEYIRLSADVIEKGLKELKNRDTPRKSSELKSAARKLAELNNYGLFEDNKYSYESIINSLLGINELDQKAFDGMREIADGYTTLMNSGFSEIAMKGAINELSRRQARLLGNYSFINGSKRFKVMTALQEITNLSTRFKLVNLGNLAENISSGIMARAYNDITDMYLAKVKGEKRTTSELKSQTSKNARAKLKGIVFEASESYGDTSSMLLDHSMIEDRINESTSNKYVHAIMSSYMGRPVLEGADSFNKILLTEAKIRNAASRILIKKGMNKREALDYISKSLTGESMDDAKVKAKTLIDEVNAKAGKKILNDSQVSVESLASDIVKDALVSGGQMTVKELEAVYNSAYKSAGRDIGHVSNNSFTDLISANNAKIEKKVADAIKEKNWRNAAYFTGQKIIYRNFVYTFVGGGTNWFVKGLQKSGNPLSYISLYDDVRLKAGKELDITSDDGIKNMEKVLYRDMNVRSTAGTIMIGSLNALLMFSALKATGSDDDLNKWLKENEWAKKFFDKMAPDVVVAMLAWENKEMGRYYSKMINQKPDFFDDTKNIQKVLDNYTKGYVEDDKSKKDKASGILGSLLGSRFDLPGPLKLAQDVKRVYKGAVKDEYEMTNYYSSGFWNGFLRGGITEAWGLRPEPASPEGQKKSKKGVPGVPNFGKMKINP